MTFTISLIDIILFDKMNTFLEFSHCEKDQ
jgi:hypothetical protein